MTAATREKVTITVTQDHINEGWPCNCGRCPVALALIAAIPGAGLADVWVEDDEARAVIWLDDERSTLNLRLPAEAHDFIAAFDGGSPVSPFAFEAEVTR
jgi:hypothetical protein